MTAVLLCRISTGKCCATAMKHGMRFIEEYEDPENIYTRVYAISREEWEEKYRGLQGRKQIVS